MKCKYLNTPFILLFIIISLTACTENEIDYENPIKIGKEENSLEQVLVNVGSERNIILSGGNGKYSVSVENSKIANAKISYDTLKISGIYQGETFATIISHNQRTKLGIMVKPTDVSISQEQLLLYPTQESKIVSISGGDIVDLEIQDPENIMDVKWNGNTGILEIFAHYEGEAKIIAKSKNQPDKVLKVKIKSEGEVGDVGMYDITSRYIYPVLTPTMIVKRKNVGVWLASSTNPYGVVTSTYTRYGFRFSPIENPIKGSYVEVDVDMRPYLDEYRGIKKGINRFIVDEVRENTVVLRTKTTKIVLPYSK